jgi:hypothetical protein
VPPSESIRDYLGSDERSLPLEATIDPGFVHRRRIQTMIGANNMRVVDELIQRLPASTPAWEREVRVDHIYKDIFLEFCRINEFPTLGDLLANGKGRVFSSIEQLAPCRNFYDVERATSRIALRGKSKYKVELQYSTKLVASDTLKSRLHMGAKIAVVALLHSFENDKLTFDPLLMGFPWLRSRDPQLQDQVMWWGYDFFEHFVEDFDEFAKVKTIKKPTDIGPMRSVSEYGFKQALGKILGDPVSKDWGGETSDHFTSHLHLKGRRVSAAFLLKGPARFAPMGLNHLGKNNDQIVRLSREPAEVLIVQHSHDILPAVRETLRAFAVRPQAARRYCLIDGRDSLWLLKAYDLLDAALEWSNRKAKA